eukprot:TRINITY_DN1149_c0_g1_i3.p1 TRINITY_DN1149_c0_g1~~TRINITY_DN1149_c0_g1_i3.p1  ORF type:complete len:389 (+),score=88.87 TRINITY_DN1149_c0_g1_i3:47-1168(+)
MFDYQFIEDEGLYNLKQYHFEDIEDLSFVNQYLFYPMLSFVMKVVPGFVAPNVFSVLGFGLVFMSYLMTLFFSEEYPVVFLLNVLCLLGYQTMRSLHNEQAFRTISHSPLGEYMDRVLDMLTLFFLSLTFNIILNVNDEWIYVTNIFLPMTLCFIVQMDYYLRRRYHQGVVTTILPLLNISEVYLCVIAANIACFFSERFFDNTVIIGDQPVALSAVFSVILIFIIAVVGIFHYLIDVKKFLDDSPLDFVKASSPIVLVNALFLAWLPYFPGDIDTLLYFYFVVFSVLIGRIILSKLTNTEFTVVEPVYFLLILSILLSLVPSDIINISTIPSTGLAFTFFYALFFFYKTLDQIAGYLNMDFFIISSNRSIKY